MVTLLHYFQQCNLTVDSLKHYKEKTFSNTIEGNLSATTSVKFLYIDDRIKAKLSVPLRGNKILFCGRGFFYS